MENWDAIIIGAGFGGLCTGALLAHGGKKVLVLEKDSSLGGRAKSILHGGQVLDDGAHIPSRAGHLESIFADLDLPFPESAELGQANIQGLGEATEQATRSSGEAMQYYERDNLAPGEEIALQLTHLDVGSSGLLIWIALGTVAGAVITLALLRLRPKKETSPQTP